MSDRTGQHLDFPPRASGPQHLHGDGAQAPAPGHAWGVNEEGYWDLNLFTESFVYANEGVYEFPSMPIGAQISMAISAFKNFLGWILQPVQLRLH